MLQPLTEGGRVSASHDRYACYSNSLKVGGFPPATVDDVGTAPVGNLARLLCLVEVEGGTEHAPQAQVDGLAHGRHCSMCGVVHKGSGVQGLGVTQQGRKRWCGAQGFRHAGSGYHTTTRKRWCGVVWCGGVLRGVVQCGGVLRGVVQCGGVPRGVVQRGGVPHCVQCGGVPRGGVPHGAVQCGVVQCGAVRCGAVWCSAMWCGVVRCGAVWHVVGLVI